MVLRGTSKVTPSTALTMGALRDCEVGKWTFSSSMRTSGSAARTTGWRERPAAAGSRAGVAGISFWGGRS